LEDIAPQKKGIKTQEFIPRSGIVLLQALEELDLLREFPGRIRFVGLRTAHQKTFQRVYRI